jgi:hypothetical protein
VPAQFFRSVRSQIDSDGRHVRCPRSPAVRLEIVNLPACILKLHFGFTPPIIRSRIASEDLNLPVLLSRALALVHPVTEGVCDVAEKLLWVGIKEWGRRQRRVGS